MSRLAPCQDLTIRGPSLARLPAALEMVGASVMTLRPTAIMKRLVTVCYNLFRPISCDLSRNRTNYVPPYES
jgi:hypothetical protein